MVRKRTRSDRISFGDPLLAVTALVWAGMVIGVSGLATPIKFTAPSLSLPVALEVGHVTFHLLSRVELGMAGLLILIGVVARPPRWSLLCIGIVLALVAVQAFWLLPALDERVAIVIAGDMPPPSSLHLWYIGVEVAKLMALLALGVGALRLHNRGKRRTTAAEPSHHSIPERA